MRKQVHTEKQYKQGQVVRIDLDGEYRVLSSICLRWLGLGTGYCTNLELIKEFDIKPQVTETTKKKSFV